MGTRLRQGGAAAGALLLLFVLLPLLTCGTSETVAAEPRTPAPVPKELISVDDGDSLTVRWKEGIEVVRLLGIDAPETIHLEHDIPYPQPFGEAAAGFLAGLLANAGRVQLLRAPKQDAFGRTLAYVLVDGRNASVLAIQARLAVETVSRYGNNGFGEESAACLAAAKTAGPVAFEEPHLYRRRMHAVSKWLKERDLYPRGPQPGGK